MNLRMNPSVAGTRPLRKASKTPIRGQVAISRNSRKVLILHRLAFQPTSERCTGPKNKPKLTSQLTVDWLAGRPLVDRERIGLVGASMGGMIAQLVAIRHPPDTSRPTRAQPLFSKHI